MVPDAHLHSIHNPRADLTPGGLYLSCAASVADWQPLLEDGRVIPFLGIHPEKITPSWRLELERLDEILTRSPRAGLGECGLDRRFYPVCTREEQEKVLRAHFELAERHGRPVVLHQVGASGALADFLGREKPRVRVMIHGFHGSSGILDRYNSLGLYISLGPGRHWDSPGFAGTARRIPRERLLVETDWPYAAAAAGSSWSEMTDQTYALISGHLGIDKTELAGIVQRNGEIFTH